MVAVRAIICDQCIKDQCTKAAADTTIAIVTDTIPTAGTPNTITIEATHIAATASITDTTTEISGHMMKLIGKLKSCTSNQNQLKDLILNLKMVNSYPSERMSSPYFSI